MDEEQITINCILECLDFGLNFHKKDIQDLLNIVKKKNEIIKKQSYTNKKMRNKLKTVRKERNKQQKVMDEMIKWIDDRCFYSDDCGNHCEIIDAPCYDITKNWNCEDCIKQYFIRKVEEDEKM